MPGLDVSARIRPGTGGLAINATSVPPSDSIRAAIPRNDAALPPLRPAVAELLRLASERADAEQLAAAVLGDIALSERLERFAASALLGQGRAVPSMRAAMVILGPRGATSAALAEALASAIAPSRSLHPDLCDAFWKRAIAAAVAARQCALDLRTALTDDAFDAALLMDLAVPARLASRGDASTSLLAICDGAHPDAGTEHEQLGTSHAELAARLLAPWPLHFALLDAIRDHHRQEPFVQELPIDRQDLAHVLSFASDIAAALVSQRGAGAALGEARRKGRVWFRMKDAEVDAFIAGLGDAIVELGTIFGRAAGTREELAGALARAQEDLRGGAARATAEIERVRARIDELQTRVTASALSGATAAKELDELLHTHWELRLKGPAPGSIGIVLAQLSGLRGILKNDGAAARDEVLRSVAGGMARACRAIDRRVDAVCLRDEDTFVVVLPELAYLDLGRVAERLRRVIEDLKVPTANGSAAVTASLGGCLLKRVSPAITPAHVLRGAALNLVAAREAGPNRCVVSVYPHA